MPLLHVCQALQWNDTLTCLELSGNTLDRDSSKQLATALVDNSTLTTLRLASMVNLDDEQFAFFFGPSLQVNSGLQVLDLSTNKLGARIAASTFCVTSSRVLVSFCFISLVSLLLLL